MANTAYAVLAGFTSGGPPASDGLLRWQAVVLDPDGNMIPSPDYGSPAAATYQIQAGDTSATIAAAITSAVQAEWEDDTITVVFVLPAA
jgi:hypothetical protein